MDYSLGLSCKCRSRLLAAQFGGSKEADELVEPIARTGSKRSRLEQRLRRLPTCHGFLSRVSLTRRD